MAENGRFHAVHQANDIECPGCHSGDAVDPRCWRAATARGGKGSVHRHGGVDCQRHPKARARHLGIQGRAAVSGSHCLATLTPLAAGATAPPDAVLFESRGAVLVIGDDAGIAEAVEEVARHHRTAAFAPGIDAVRFAARVTAVGSRVTALQGRFGAFRGQMRGPEGPLDIGPASPHRDGLFDLVLDLGLKPLVALEVAPLGYFAPGADTAARAEAMRTLRHLVGSFTKPRYFDYQTNLCAHGASGLTGCTRCLDVCATAAITSVGDRIRVDPYLCQGCASCTLACPTGALSFRLPPREALRQRLVEALLSVAPPPVLVVHGSGQTAAVQGAAGADGVVALVVDPLPAFGEEQWLDAFALGAAAVALIDDAGMPTTTRALVTARVTQARILLQALGIAPQRLGFIAAAELANWLGGLPGHDTDAPRAAPDASAPAHAAVPSTPARPTKRRALLGAIARLGTAAAATAPTALPAGACFGEVVVDRERCTLCFACAHLCPTAALSADDGRMQRLRFAEDACVQCGLCERGCPEKAVSLQPRFRPQASLRGAIRVLNEDPLLACTSCGKPFISGKLLAASLARLKDHPAFVGVGRERLLTCPDCRRVNPLHP